MDPHSSGNGRSNWPSPYWPIQPLGGPWWGDPKETPNRGSEFAQLVNCVHGYCRYPKPVHLLKEPSFSTYTTQKILDGLYFIFRFERFADSTSGKNEPLKRQAVQEVVRRVHSEYPPCFLAVTRLTYSLMDGERRLGVLTPYASRGGHLSCHFVADPAFTAIQTLFEEANQLTNNRVDWEEAYEKVAALGLSLLREDGKKGELNELRIHEGEASFSLSSPSPHALYLLSQTVKPGTVEAG
jgi:hypothetical protein